MGGGRDRADVLSDVCGSADRVGARDRTDGSPSRDGRATVDGCDACVGGSRWTG